MKINMGPYKDKRKISIKLDKYDTWNMDHTLSLIILPMLKQLKETKHGSPFVDDIDVPEHLRSFNAAPKENDWDTDEFFFARWDWVMDEMIWTFETHIEDNYFDYVENEERLANGLRLFGKYFRSLWD
jgi:hypothetical protein